MCWIEDRIGLKLKEANMFMSECGLCGAKTNRSLNNTKCNRFQWFQRKSRSSLRNPSLEDKALIWTVCTVLLTFTRKLSDLTFPWEKLALFCYHLCAFLLLPASGVMAFCLQFPLLSKATLMRPWSTGRKTNLLWSAWLLPPMDGFPWWSI